MAVSGVFTGTPERRHLLQVHKDANGKKALRLDSASQTIEVVQKNFKVLVRFNPDGTATVTNYDLNGNPSSNVTYHP